MLQKQNIMAKIVILKFLEQSLGHHNNKYIRNWTIHLQPLLVFQPETTFQSMEPVIVEEYEDLMERGFLEPDGCWFCPKNSSASSCTASLLVYYLDMHSTHK